MGTFQICLLFAGVSFCLAFAGLSKTLFARVSLRFFLLYLLFEALNFLFEWLLVHPSSVHKATWLALLMASSFLMAPCVWLFAREIQQNATPRVWPPAWGQVAVVLVGCMLTIPLLLASYGGTLLSDPSIPRTSLSSWIHVTMVLAVVLFLIQVPWYIHRTLALFREHHRMSKFLFSSLNEPAHNALQALIWVMVANWVLGLARTLRVIFYGPSQQWDVLFSTGEVVVTIGALYVIFKRCWHYNQEDQRLLQTFNESLLKETNNQIVQPSEPLEANKKYANSSLDEATRARVLKKVKRAFECEKIHRQSGLKLQGLCLATNESAHYVSQVINQDLGMSFFDVVNQYRVEEAKEKLLQSQAQTILEVALEVGFNSKSTFNKAFKGVTGQTPSAFRAQ